uniref:UDP-N-acetylmuramoyl-tripeptide--D-alanyl-D-alanine ligase n=1 Tax=Candidatus Kentrum sp. TUN TaxID=2126343 RepID=A0A450ZEX2_9GAMM|nr:MAG: UDP-N-acetylmuramoyl-tripeptide--D-alanyl-D-alanine ligase [Candidatus Kentron sp. TUN]VFK52738.1 MAG: UDP-N-acetylmuramoyl-tripeptide--D-alanyl-D-alanine ligase [Candidatus Kentron sp. TUN]
MIRMHISEAAWLLGADYSGPDGVFQGCGIDSRVLPTGALFVALPGQHRDGHDFVNFSADQGAAAAMVERSGVHYPLPTIDVDDCHHALGQLASIWRKRFRCQLVAVTGSNGKTTVKELLAAILGKLGPTHATQGNLNNDLGVPLTLLGLSRRHRWAVVEMGANHPNEITALARIARPTIGVITQCAPAHLEGFGDIGSVAKAKGELLAGLGRTGIAIINADDPYADLWRNLAGDRRLMTFGLDNPADVSADYQLELDRVKLTLKTPFGHQDAQIALPGRHNVLNALAATAAAIAAGCSLEIIAKGLMSAGKINGRLQVKYAQNGSRIIDDTYNANPGSLMAALKVLANYGDPRWLILGDMGELGDEGPELHEQVGIVARESGVTRLFAMGTLSRYTVNAFGSGGYHYTDSASLLSAMRTELPQETTVLVKGSRHMQMEKVVNELLTW